MKDTITAIATPTGRGGVGVVRVSGPKVKAIAEKILGKLPKTRYAHFAAFQNQQGDTIDEGLALFFEGPNSFTGEDVLELQGHGGPVVMDMLLKTVIEFGARMAKPGEFSERAFLNDKLDLTQAEAIADLIDASSQQAVKSALNSLKGAFSAEIQTLLKQVIDLRMYVEAAIDFPEEEIDFLAEGKVADKAKAILNQLDVVRAKANQGKLLKEGLKVCILGKPNAGKSSLLNALSGEESAIVTDIPGTTRDILKEHIQIDGMPLHIIDTAGLRETDDKVESIGVERALQAASNADLLLMLMDVTDASAEKDLRANFSALFELSIPSMSVYNKMDLVDAEALKSLPEDALCVSAKTNDGLDKLKKQLEQHAGYEASEGVFSARRRHLDALDKAREHVVTGIEQVEYSRSGELLAEELRLAQNHLSEITGEFRADDLLGVIFSSFCIGK